MHLETTKEALSTGDFDAVESHWLTRVAEDPSDLDFFSSVTSALVNRGEEDLVTTLLEMLDDQLVERGLWSERLDLIRSYGKYWLRSGHVFETVMTSLQQCFADRGDELAMHMETVGLDGTRDETPNLWDKVERIRNLFSYEIGTIVAMKGKGVGTVVDVDLELQKLKVDFEKLKGVSVGFRAAGTMLQLLPEGHVLRRKVEEPATLKKLDPPELLRLTLESYDGPLTGAEVRAAVTGIVAKKSWSSWWASARKHPQVVVEGGTRQRYRWAQSSAHAEDALWEAFDSAEPRERLDLLRRAGNQDDALVEKMVNALAADGERLMRKQPGLAFEIWQALDKIDAAPKPWGPADVLAKLDDPKSLFDELGTRALRELAYQLVRDERDDWVEVLTSAVLSETDPRALSTLASLLEQDSEEARDRAIDQALSQPRKTAAAFTWLAERATEDEALRGRRGLRILKQILVALGDETFSEFHTRLGVLADSGGAIPAILPDLSAEEAAEAEKAIEEARGLEDFRRDPLLVALHLRFPELRRSDESPLYALAESLEAKQKEMKRLLEEEIPANRKAIEEARALGDLRENFEYKSARERHEYLASRAAELDSQLSRAKVLDLDRVDSTEVRVGTRVQLSDGRSLAILGPWESDPDAGIVSFESDLAQSLLGKKPGEEIEVGGETIRVEEVGVYSP